MADWRSIFLFLLEAIRENKPQRVISEDLQEERPLKERPSIATKFK